MLTIINHTNVEYIDIFRLRSIRNQYSYQKHKKSNIKNTLDLLRTATEDTRNRNRFHNYYERKRLISFTDDVLIANRMIGQNSMSKLFTPMRC